MNTLNRTLNSQIEKDKSYVLYFAPLSLFTYELELLAIVLAQAAWRHYVHIDMATSGLPHKHCAAV
jgi:hypothetical protein